MCEVGIEGSEDLMGQKSDAFEIEFLFLVSWDILQQILLQML